MQSDTNKKKGKNIANKFRKVFTEEVKSKLRELENKRIFYILGVIGCYVAIVLIIFFCIYFAQSFENTKETKSMSEFLCFSVAVLSFTSYLIVKKYKKRAKEITLPVMVKCLGDFNLVYGKSDEDKKYISNSVLFPPFNTFSLDDRIEGTYKNLPVDISEVSISNVSGSGKNRSERIFFRGIFLKVPLNKSTKGITIIKSKGCCPSKIKGLTIKLEDPEFMKKFNVTSTDQIEARYLITTAFMERLLKIAAKKIGKISVSFENGYVNIAVDTKFSEYYNFQFLEKDWFEISILKAATDIKNYREVLREIEIIISLIDTLKLEQNIGM